MASKADPIFQTHQPKQQEYPMKAEALAIHLESTAEKFLSKFILLLFYLHLILLSILISFLTIRGIMSATGSHRKNLLHFYLPLLTSTLIAALTGFACQVAARKNPSKTLRSVFWLSPLLTCAGGVLLLSIGTVASLGTAAFALILALIQSLYGCWAVPRMDHATRMLSVSLSAPTSKSTSFLALSLIGATFYSSICVSGLGGLAEKQTQFDPLFIFVILLSLSWTMQTIRIALHVAISRPVYMHFVRVMDIDTRVAFDDTVKHSMGSVCLGSLLVPTIGVFRGSARVMNSIAGDTDEFMFSCASCYTSVADRLVLYGNRWGFVHVGVYSKGIIRASIDTWEMFERVGMKSLIDSDLIGTFCFLCGVAGGSFCGLVGGSWALAVAVQKDYVTQVSIYAFFIGYLMIRIAMAWPQACVSAYHVAFAENPESPQFDSTIPCRLQELQRSQV